MKPRYYLFIYVQSVQKTAFYYSIVQIDFLLFFINFQYLSSFSLPSTEFCALLRGLNQLNLRPLHYSSLHSTILCPINPPIIEPWWRVIMNMTFTVANFPRDLLYFASIKLPPQLHILVDHLYSRRPSGAVWSDSGMMMSYGWWG